ncbi:hypothetical protein [Candidatus Poriferisocius sp.]|uniref:hypothetical protein n=1 Tax=Candidatus Poriferisocius sp. TaxID=3101276 RepID=UPI003B01310F
MSDERRTPEDLTRPDDQALGAALGAAIGESVGAPAARPPVAHIAERAAARAKARNTRRAVAGIAASVALVAGGVAVWNAYDDSTVTEVVVVDQPGSTVEPGPTAAPGDDSPDTPQAPPAAGADPATPESLSTGPVLEWTEFDPATVFGAELSYIGSLESVGDGRVMVQAGNSDVHQVMISANGADWTVVPMPPDFDVESVDIAGDRWLVTGWPTARLSRSMSQAMFSDDRGATWTDLAIPHDLADETETASVAAALVSGENMVVAVVSRTRPDVASVIVARGLAPDKESIRGWTSVEGDTVSFTRDESSSPESFELTSEEEEFLFGGIQRHVRLYFSDGGPAELVAEYPCWDTAGYGADDGFRLWLNDSEGEWLLTSPDGRQWLRSPLVDGNGVPVGRTYTYTGMHQETVWTAGQTGSDYRVERSDGVYAPPLVAELPAGIRRVDLLAVGPAGIAVTAEAGSLPGFGDIPELRLAKDGYELRYNEPAGGLTLWDLTADAAVYVFDFDDLGGDALPAGVRRVGGDNDGPEPLAFDDPDTGAELVIFTVDELESLVAGAYPAVPNSTFAYSPTEQWVGWSAGGGKWGWQSLSAAFGLSDLTEEQKEFTEVSLAVGEDFAIARVRTYEVESYEVAGDGEGDGAVELAPQPLRWFIATVE